MDDFARALTAVSYLLGARGDDLRRALGAVEPPAALLRTLSSEDRQARAAALAVELARIGVAVDRASVS